MKIKYKSYTLVLKEYILAVSKWHSWFAWYPVRISDTEIVWLQKVQRKAAEISTFGKVSYWKYKL